MRGNNKAQISLEYLILIGFIMFALIGILGISYYYQSSIRDSIRNRQLENFGKGVISSSESIYYAGMPSKTTVKLYLPEGVKSIDIIDNSLVIEIQLSSGVNKQSFFSNVPIGISGTITPVYGYKKLAISTNETSAIITQN